MSRHSNTPVLKLVFFFVLFVDNFVCGCLVPWFQSAFRVVPYPHAPNRMADHGGTAPYWLGAAQLEAGDSCPVRSEDLSPVGSNPWRPALLHVSDGSKGTAEPLQFGTSEVAGVARMRLSTTTKCLRDSSSGFFLEVYS